MLIGDRSGAYRQRATKNLHDLYGIRIACKSTMVQTRDRPRSGEKSMMYSVIDIGSNTIRLTVYQVENGQIETVFREKNTAGLAGYVGEKGKLSRAGINRAVEALNRFQTILQNLSIENVAVFATASLRNIVNTDEALEAIQGSTGFQVEVLSGEKEALLDYVGATHFLPAAEGLLVDIGGGSTELVFFHHGEVRKAVSLPVGSLNMYNKYVTHLLPDKSERERIERRVLKELEKLDLPKLVCPVICGVGGSIRATGKMVNAREKLPGANRTVYLHTVSELLESFRQENKENLFRLLSVTPERIHTLLPGMTILRRIAKTFCSDTMIISDYGVREGYLISEVLPQLPQKQGGGA